MARLLMSIITVGLIIAASHDAEQSLTQVTPPLPRTITYTVQPGDTLFAIRLAASHQRARVDGAERPEPSRHFHRPNSYRPGTHRSVGAAPHGPDCEY